MNNNRFALPSKRFNAPRNILIGTEWLSTVPDQAKTAARIILRAENGDYFSLTDDMLSKGILLIGKPGCGKTNVFNMILDQTVNILGDDDIVFILDTKGDYIARYFDRNNQKHILIDPTDTTGTAKSWNVFGELFSADGGITGLRLNAHEISKMLFSNVESSTQPFFHISSCDIFSMILCCIMQDAQKSHDFSKANNTWLCSFLSELSIDSLYKMTEQHPEFKFIEGYLGDKNKPTTQSLGITGFINAMVNTQFIGTFRERSNAGQFSIKRIVREKGGKVVFLKFDINYRSLLAPVYSLLYDMAIKEAASIGKGSSYFFCDEMSLLPYCKSFKSATNYGRSKGIKLISGIQNINQLYDNYGEYGGRSIAAGFGTSLCFNANDADTRKFVSERFGGTFESISFAGTNLPHEGSTVYDSDIRGLDIGEAFIDIHGCDPFRFKFMEQK